MAAYSLAKRFLNFPGPCRVGNTDPGAYEITSAFVKGKVNKVPFISSKPRKTSISGVIYTDTIYNAEKSHRILGGETPFKSRVQRFKAREPVLDELYNEDGECACSEGQEQEAYTEVKKEVCQGDVYKKLYKGPVPHRKSGPSVPSKRHRYGYTVLQNGETELIVLPAPDNTLGPAFYRTSKTQFRCERYRGWRWRAPCTGARTPAGGRPAPGPADYQLERPLTCAELCAQQTRSKRARTSRQIRFMDAVIQKCRLEQQPGPADYTPLGPTGRVAPPVGPRAFISRAPRRTLETAPGPGPADYDAAGATCGRASVLEVPFGVFQKRFQAKVAVGPGPGYYEVPRFGEEQARDPCTPHPPFGVSTILPSDMPDVMEERVEMCEPSPIDRQVCTLESSVFKSRRPRFSRQFVKQDEPSPADISVQGAWLRAHGRCVRRRAQQALAPFDSSEGRFRAWRNYMSINDFVDTPGPGALEVLKPRVRDVTFSKDKRFADWDNGLPAPNQYKITKGVDDVNKTYNKHLSLSTQRGRMKLQFNYAKGRRLARREAPHVNLELALTARMVHLLQPAFGELKADAGTGSGARSPRGPPRVRDVVAAERRPRLPGERVFLETFVKSHQVVQYF